MCFNFFFQLFFLFTKQSPFVTTSDLRKPDPTSPHPLADARDPRHADLRGGGLGQSPAGTGRGMLVPGLAGILAGARSGGSSGGATVGPSSTAGPTSGVLGGGSGFANWFRVARVGDAAFAPALTQVGEYWAHVHLFEQEVPGGRASEETGVPAALELASLLCTTADAAAAPQAATGGIAALADEIAARAREFEGYGWLYVVLSSHPALARSRLALDPADPARWSPLPAAAAGAADERVALIASVSDQVPGAILPGCVPVIAVDLWEHAYFDAHGAGPEARERHARESIANVDWDVVAARMSRGRPFRDLRAPSQLRALLAHTVEGGELESGADL
jgi:hypothetical protein